MSSPRELLGLVAAAAGAKMTDYSDGTPDHWVIKNARGIWVPWDPDCDDGDAVRLALQLRMEITGRWRYVKVKAEGFVIDEGCEDTPESRNAAMRAAVMRIAGQMALSKIEKAAKP